MQKLIESNQHTNMKSLDKNRTILHILEFKKKMLCYREIDMRGILSS